MLSRIRDILFNIGLAEKGKQEGIARAAAAKKVLLEKARNFAYQIAYEKGSVTIDDVHERLVDRLEDYEPVQLGKAAGAVFKGNDFRPVGWAQSRRTDCHRRDVRVWELKHKNVRFTDAYYDGDTPFWWRCR